MRFIDVYEAELNLSSKPAHSIIMKPANPQANASEQDCSFVFRILFLVTIIIAHQLYTFE